MNFPNLPGHPAVDALQKYHRSFHNMPQWLLSHNERDKLLRFASYAFSAIGIAWKSQHFKKLSEDISSIRIFDRLFDGIPCVLLTRDICAEKTKKKINIYDAIEVLEYISYACYYPVEHIAWCSDRSLISRKLSSPAWTVSIILWACGLGISIIKNLMIIFGLQLEETRNRKTKKNYLIVLRDLCDFMNAIHFLPSGVLWSSKLPPQLSNLFGLISSTIYLLFCHIQRN